MKKSLIVYSSLTGNTIQLADEIKDRLKQNGIATDVKDFNAGEVVAEDLLHYEMVFVGVYTWAAGDIPFEAEPLFDQLSDLDLQGKICAVFGSADKAYGPLYGVAVELFYKELEKQGATMVPPPFIVDMEPSSSDLEGICQLVDQACALNQKSSFNG